MAKKVQIFYRGASFVAHLYNKRGGRAICFTLSGFRICLWNASTGTNSGRCFAQTKVFHYIYILYNIIFLKLSGLPPSGATNSTDCIWATRSSPCWSVKQWEREVNIDLASVSHIYNKNLELWDRILESQIETGTPYILYKDACNRKNNQQNLGTLRCSNLCTEILEYVSPEETAVCNLASLSLPAYITTTANTVEYNYALLEENTRLLVRNLNRVIDRNYYPTKQSKNSNLKHRPIGIGVQGLADTFVAFKYSWESAEARVLNRRIFEHIYYAALGIYLKIFFILNLSH